MFWEALGRYGPQQHEGSTVSSKLFQLYILSSLSSFRVCTFRYNASNSHGSAYRYKRTHKHTQKAQSHSDSNLKHSDTPCNSFTRIRLQCAKPSSSPPNPPPFSYCVQLHCWAFPTHTKAITMSYTARGRERERVLLNMSSLNKNAPSIDFVFMQWCHSFQLGWHEGLRVREFSRFFPPLISLSFLYTCSMCGMDVQCTHIGWLFLSVSFIIWTADTGKMLVTLFSVRCLANSIKLMIAEVES